jgi:hypothetical protein
LFSGDAFAGEPTGLFANTPLIMLFVKTQLKENQESHALVSAPIPRPIAVKTPFNLKNQKPRFLIFLTACLNKKLFLALADSAFFV